jgi:hypothetical protein
MITDEELRRARVTIAVKDAALDVADDQIAALKAENTRLREAYTGAMEENRIWKMRAEYLEAENARLREALQRMASHTPSDLDSGNQDYIDLHNMVVETLEADNV